MKLLQIGILLTVFWPMAAAVLGYGIGRKNKKLRDLAVNVFLLVEMLLAGILAYQGALGTVVICEVPEICGRGLFFKLDGFRGLFVLLSAFLWMMSTLLAVEYMHHERNRNRYYLYLMLTLGAAMGVFLSADLFTTFIFFEIMSFTSYVWVAQNETKEAMSAAGTYLGIAVVGGMILLMGLFLLYQSTGTLRMDELLEASRAVRDTQERTLYASGFLILLGFGAKAAMFPLHVWMPRAHTVAPAPASALLSGILTKAGLFGILVISGEIFFEDENWGRLILLLGVITMLLGAVLAVFAVNLKRTLACSSMSQMGFVLVGIAMGSLLGEEGALAVRGAVLHMMNHSLFKLILFLTAGVVFMNLEQLELNDVRGFGRNKPLLQAVYLSGALGIGGIPFFSGYISKTLIHESMVEFIHEAGSMAIWYHMAEWCFLFAGGLTVAYMLKLYVALFVNRHPERQEEFDRKSGNYANRWSRSALLGSAVWIPLFGAFPGFFMDRIADMTKGFFHAEPLHHAVHYFAWENLKGGLISITIGILVYTLFIRRVIMVEEARGCWRYVDRWPAVIDLEKKIYVPLFTRLLPFLGGVICYIPDHLMDWSWPIIVRVGIFILRFLERMPDFIFMLLREFVFNPLRLLTAEEEEEKIRRHREHRNRMNYRKWSTITLSFGFLSSCMGILIMMVWVFTTLLR